MLVTRGFYKKLTLCSILFGLSVLSYCIYISIKSANLRELCVTHTIGIIDGVALKRQAKCFSVHEETSKMLNEVFENMRNSEQKIKLEYEQIRTNKKLKPKQKQQEISNIERRWKTISTDYNKRVNDIRTLDHKLVEKINNTLASVLTEISSKLNLILIINKGTENSLNVFYNATRMDITPQVVNALNEKLANFSVKSVS